MTEVPDPESSSLAGANVIRFAPPYIVERHQLDEAVGILRSVLAEGVGK